MSLNVKRKVIVEVEKALDNDSTDLESTFRAMEENTDTYIIIKNLIEIFPKRIRGQPMRTDVIPNIMSYIPEPLQDSNIRSVIKLYLYSDYTHIKKVFLSKRLKLQIDFTNFEKQKNENIEKQKNVKQKIVSKYGKIDNWDVCQVTNMSNLFYNCYLFNEDISSWDVSNVTNMSNMFACARSFNQSLSNWDVSNVTNMSNMFYNAIKFNQPLNNWDVSNITTMEGMFNNAINFNQPLNNWNVSNVKNMKFMFKFTNYFNDTLLLNWNISKDVIITGIFFGVRKFNEYRANWIKLQNVNHQNKLNQTYLKVYNVARKNGCNPREAMDKATFATKFSNNEIISKKNNHNLTEDDLVTAYRLRSPNILGIVNVNMNCNDYLETLRNL
tara:strand:- start:188 stop:1339 length:1152 start_codon:yes stop_codon:yes gene_type:complete